MNNPVINTRAGIRVSGGHVNTTPKTSPIDFLFANKGHTQTSGFGRMTLSGLQQMAAKPRIGHKHSAPAFAQHNGSAKTKEAAMNAQFSVVLLDLDDGDYSALSIKQMLKGMAYLAWTSSSHTTEKPRWKIVIPLTHSLSAAEWLPIAQGSALTFGADLAQSRVQQICYAPNRLSMDAPYEHLDNLRGEPLDPMGSIAQSFRERFEAEREHLASMATPKPRTAPQGKDGESIINMTNHAFDVRGILEQHGYQRRGQQKYLAPSSKSGIPGVRILTGDDGRERVFSHHSRESDPLADGHSHDVFDLLVEFRFHGNVTEAVKVLANELDPEGQKARQRAYAQEMARKHGTRVLENSLKNPQANQNAQEEEDYLTNPPKLAEVGLFGLIGEIAHKGTEGKEPDPASVALAAIIRLSALVGRDLYIAVGDTRHTLNLYGLHIGRSAIGAKGESFSLVNRIMEKLASDKPNGKNITAQSHTSGLSSREGLAMLIHDGFQQGKEEHSPIDDKRLFLRESEFANLLAQSKRDGNTISPALRDVWDAGQSIKPLTKTSQLWATDPHVALHGAITPLELLQKLDANEASNGFLNRFLICFAERVCLVPLPEPTRQIDVSILASRVEKVVLWAKGNYPTDKYTRCMELSDQAKKLWINVYPKLKKRTAHGEMISAILERRAPITLRIAGLFAVTDMSLTIEVHHLQAALAWATFHKESVIYVFGRDAEQQKAAQLMMEYRNKIMDALKCGDWLTRTVLRKAFNNHLNNQTLDHALAGLLEDKHIERKQEKNKKNAGKKISYRALQARTAQESGFVPKARLANPDANQAQACKLQPAIMDDVPDCAEKRTECAVEEPYQNTLCAQSVDCAQGEHHAVLADDEIIEEVVL